MRAFLGIDFDSESFKKINNLMLNLSKSGVKGNFTKKDNLHLTLLFLGELNKEEINQVENIMDSIDFDDFTVEIKKLTSLKDMLVLEVESEKLMLLQKEISSKVSKTKIKFDDKKYYPHITLVRKSSMKLEKELNINGNVNCFYLYSSQRVDGNLVYKKEYERESNSGRN